MRSTSRSAGTGPHFITLAERLPPADHVVIDGLSQSGATATAPNIFLSRTPSVDPFMVPEAISVAQTTIRGLGFIGFQGFSSSTRSSFETTTTSTRA